MHRLTFAGPRSAPTATPAKVQPRGRAGRVDDAARLECWASNPATYMSSPGPKARRRGRVVPRSVWDGRIWPRPVSPSRGWGGSVGRSTGWPTLARRCAGPGSRGGWSHSATRRGHLGQGPKGYALAEPAEESGAIPQRGQWWPRGRYRACTGWGGRTSRRARSRPQSGPLGPRSFLICHFPAKLCILQTWEGNRVVYAAHCPCCLSSRIFQPCHAPCCGTPEPTLLFALMCFCRWVLRAGPAGPAAVASPVTAPGRGDVPVTICPALPGGLPVRSPRRGRGGRAPCSGPLSPSLSLFCVTASRVPRAL